MPLSRLFSALLLVALGASMPAVAQKSAEAAGKVIWGFPITSYTVSLNDTALVVQVVLPNGGSMISPKQLGVLRGTAAGDNIDTAEKGWGRCHLIKGEYYYFAIHQKGPSGPKAGDLVYTFIPRPAGFAGSAIARCASHGITFLDVEDSAFYKPTDFLNARTKTQNDALMQKMVADVQRTGVFFQKESPEMNAAVDEGPYAGRKVLDVMTTATAKDLTDFMEYVYARPIRYAGNRWKVSETFATWVMAGAPRVE